MGGKTHLTNFLESKKIYNRLDSFNRRVVMRDNHRSKAFDNLILVMRIVSDDYERMVFNNRIYYTGLRRKFEKGDKVFFVRKKEVDSFIGWAIIGDVKKISEIKNREEIELCIRNGWFIKLEFKHIERFENPIPIKIVFPGMHLLGRKLHGFRLYEDECNRILLFRDIIKYQVS